MSTAEQIRTAKLATAFNAWVNMVPATPGFVSEDAAKRLKEADRIAADVLEPLIEEARAARKAAGEPG